MGRLKFTGRDLKLTQPSSCMEDVNLSRSAEISVKDFYDIENTSQFVKPYSIVALQFPDQLLPDSVEIVGLLQELNPTTRFYILADTSYGSECVDEVAAEHILAQCIVHYGRAVVVNTTRLPVYYVFGRYPIDVNDCLTKMQEFLNNQTVEMEAILFYESYYSYIIPELEGKLNKTLITKIPSSTIGKGQDNEVQEPVSNYRFNGRFLDIPYEITKKNIILYIGSESSLLLNLILTYNENSVYRYNPISKEFEIERFQKNKLLQKRFMLVEKAKEAKLFGIVIGTLAMENYLQIIEYVKSMIKSAGKKYYVIVVGKLNVPKLSNFPEIDIFVLIAGPENSLVDSKDYYRPIITPFELEIALVRGKTWTNKYNSDFTYVLQNKSNLSADDKEDEEEYRLSLITGKMERNAKYNKEIKYSQSTELSLRNPNGEIQIYTATNAFEARTFKGLEPKIGETEVKDFIEGQNGLPFTGYSAGPDVKKASLSF